MPLLFEIYSGGRRLTDYLVRGGHATGPESLPLAGRVAFEEGLLRVEVGESDVIDPYGASSDPGDEAAAYANRPADAPAVGVSLLWDAGSAGEYVLETPRLPPTHEPYILNVELARHRLMRLMQKQEDWNLWDLTPAAGAVARAKSAMLIFAEALSLLDDRPAASMKADEALAVAIQAGEMLARVHGDLLMQRRRRAGLPRTLFGVRADVTGNAPLGNAAYRSAILKHFDCVSVPMPWRLMQPEEETFETASVDAAVDLAARAKLPIVAGPLIDLSDTPEPAGKSGSGGGALTAGGVPEWLFLYENNFEALRDLAFNYVRAIVQRYRRVVKLWNVVSGIHAAQSFGLTFEQMIELTRLLVGQVKAVLPGAKTLVTIRQPFGEYLTAASGSATAVPPMLYAEMVSQSGVQVDGFGVEIVTGRPTHGRRVRDLFQISAMLDRFATLGKPLFVTSVSCPDTTGGDAGKAGRWAGPWSREVQAAWLRDVYNVSLAKPYVENVAWSDLVDGPHNQIDGGGLLDDLLVAKPAAQTLQQIRSAARPYLRAGRGTVANAPAAAASREAGTPSGSRS